MPDEIQYPQLPFLTREMLSFGPQSEFKLRVNTIGNTSVILNLTAFTRSGNYTFQLTTLGGSSPETFDFGISDIPIYCSVTIDDESDDGVLTQATVQLLIDGDIAATLTQGLINVSSSIGWPHVAPLTIPQTHGMVQKVQLIAPAVGEDLDDEVPNNEIWEVHNISMFLTADANAADRTVILDIDGEEAGLRRASGTVQTAGEAIQYVFVPGGTTAEVVADTLHEIALPVTPLIIPAGTALSTAITNKQAGDTLTDILFTVRRWIQTD